MLVPVHHTDQRIDVQPASVVGDTWTTEVVPCLPAALAAQARTLKAFQRVRGVATPADLLAGRARLRLGGVVDAPPRRLGRPDWPRRYFGDRLAQASPRLQRLAALAAGRTHRRATTRQWGPLALGSRRVRLIDATRLRHPGGTGDDWRVHFAYDFTAGRMDEVAVTDQHSAERLAHFTLRPGDIAVADNGYGYRSQRRHGGPPGRRGGPADHARHVSRGDRRWGAF